MKINITKQQMLFYVDLATVQTNSFQSAQTFIGLRFEQTKNHWLDSRSILVSVWLAGKWKSCHYKFKQVDITTSINQALKVLLYLV